jgi:hypothetical protein
MKRVVITIGEHPHTFDVVREARGLLLEEGQVTMFGCDVCTLLDMPLRPCGTFSDVVRVQVEPAASKEEAC